MDSSNNSEQSPQLPPELTGLVTPEEYSDWPELQESMNRAEGSDERQLVAQQLEKVMSFQSLDEYLAEQLQNPEFRDEWERQRPLFETVRQRIAQERTDDLDAHFAEQMKDPEFREAWNRLTLSQ
jgi:hypothetical protein